MDFGSEFVFAPPKAHKEEYEAIPESRYKHIVTGYASPGQADRDFQDDGEVSLQLFSYNNHYYQR